MKKIILFSILYIFNIEIYCQNLNTENLLWRNIGPANMMGRIAAIDASNSDYRKVLIASASGVFLNLKMLGLLGKVFLTIMEQVQLDQ